MLYKNEDGDTLSALGVMLVMASALSYAIYIVGANRPILKNIPTVKLTFYVLVFGLCGSAATLVFVAELSGIGTFPDGHFLSLHYGGCALYRCNGYRHIGGDGAGGGCGDRCAGVW